MEDIQDSVEEVLSQAGYADVAKAYILYRKQREKLRNMKSTILDYKETVNNYVNVTDWRVKENSTVTYSVGGLILSNSGAITATTAFRSIRRGDRQRPRKSIYHITIFQCSPLCAAGPSVSHKRGLGGVTARSTASPRSTGSLCNQMVTS